VSKCTFWARHGGERNPSLKKSRRARESRSCVGRTILLSGKQLSAFSWPLKKGEFPIAQLGGRGFGKKDGLGRRRKTRNTKKKNVSFKKETQNGNQPELQVPFRETAYKQTMKRTITIFQEHRGEIDSVPKNQAPRLEVRSSPTPTHRPSMGGWNADGKIRCIMREIQENGNRLLLRRKKEKTISDCPGKPDLEKESPFFGFIRQSPLKSVFNTICSK